MPEETLIENIWPHYAIMHGDDSDTVLEGLPLPPNKTSLIASTKIQQAFREPDFGQWDQEPPLGQEKSQ